MVYMPTNEHMRSLLLNIFENHKEWVESDNELLLSDLYQSEIDEFLRLSIGFFYPEDLSLLKPLEALQAYLSTEDKFDKEVVAERFKESILSSIERQMQAFLNTGFNEYKEDRNEIKTEKFDK